jgi:hypothetical protein
MKNELLQRIRARWAYRLGDSPERLAEYPDSNAPGRFITKNELLSLRKLLSHSLADRPGSYRDAIPASDARAILATIPDDDARGPLHITPAHAEQGLRYLRGLAWTLRGNVRQSSPFGYRERAVVGGAWEAFKRDPDTLRECFELVDMWDAGSNGWPFYLPVFRLHGTGGCFDYVGRSWQVEAYGRNGSIPFIIG